MIKQQIKKVKQMDKVDWTMLGLFAGSFAVLYTSFIN